MKCDYCGSTEDLIRVNNLTLWDKDVLFFCRTKDCEKRYQIEDEYHNFCNICDKLISLGMQSYEIIDGLCYHSKCLEAR